MFLWKLKNKAIDLLFDMLQIKLHYCFAYILGIIFLCHPLNAQLIAYNDGLAVVTVASGTLITIQGGLTSKQNGVDGQIDNQGTIQLTGSVINNNSSANIFLTSVSGTVILNGTSMQNIGGSVVSDFYSLNINNTSGLSNGITLDKSITVTNTLDLNTGVINTSSANIITLNDGATTSIGNDSSYIDGPMNYKMGIASSRTLNMPLGKNNDWRPVELTPTHSASTVYTYTSELFNGDANNLGNTLPGTFDHVSHLHYYQISRSSVSDLTGAVIKIYYSATNGTDDKVLDSPNLGVAKSNGSGGWVDYTSGAGSANGTGSITSASFTSFSHFSLANKIGSNNPLPIELLMFSAKPNKSVVDINWSTATEINNDYFTIERSSDGLNFESIAKVAGAGNSSKKLNYSTIDQKPLMGVSYYRLRQTDYDGKYKHSDLVAVEFNPSETLLFTIYPNPASAGEAPQLKFNSDETKNVLVVVFDADGKEVFSKVTIVEKGPDQVVAIDPSNILPAGIYVISASSDNTMYRQKLIIK
ncbi:MAG: T9SS type A sorting domain-containing protein [Bacteroidetes bacterium]|nr:T9SS type A sorting domain-containing protein [Bacteroidota bacterium]